MDHTTFGMLRRARNNIQVLSTILLLCGSVTVAAVHASQQSLDPTFGSNGRVRTKFAAGPGFFSSLTVGPDGRIIAVGDAGSDAAGVIARYLPDGHLDKSFGSKGQIFNQDVTSFRRAVVQPDGKIVVAGSGQGGSDDPAYILARYNLDGSLDTSFGSSGEVPGSFSGPVDGIEALAIQPDDKIILGGETVIPVVVGDSTTAIGDFALARYNPDGTPDTTFGTAGKVITDFFGDYDRMVDVLVQPDGKIIAGGMAGRAEPEAGPVFALARYNPDGSLDSAFGSGGKVTLTFADIEDALYAVALAPDGKILAGGNAILPGPVSVIALARFNPDGTLDSSFGYGGKVETQNYCGQIMAIHFLPDSKILASGPSCNRIEDTTFLTVRYNPDGSQDTTFGKGGISTGKYFGKKAFPSAVIFQPDGKVLAGGSINGPHLVSRFAIARYKVGRQ